MDACIQLVAYHLYVSCLYTHGMFQKNIGKLHQLFANGKCSTAFFKDRITFLRVQISDSNSVSFVCWLLVVDLAENM